MKIRERFVFLWGFLRDAPRIGSVTPSSRRLALAITAEMTSPNGARRILEVGAGTGVITREIVSQLRENDTLDIYEMNQLFAKHLRKEFGGNGTNGQVRVFEADVISSPPTGKYDHIISGLPLNNFRPERVRSAFQTFVKLLSDGGRLSFYQYIFGRPVQSVFVGGKGRRRLREVGTIFREFIDRHEYRRVPVLRNFPPAVAHHLEITSDKNSNSH